MNHSTSIEASHPVVAGHEITTDEHGRFNLNAIHRASEKGSHKLPSQWSRRRDTQELIAELKSQRADLHFEPLSAVRGGAYPGTYAHELLAISYAGWISPKFQLLVNQVFIDYRMGRLQQIRQKDADNLSNLKALCAHAQWIHRQWEAQLRPALSILSSPVARELDEHIGTLTLLANHLQRKAEALPSAA